ncbi:hypothetical protein GCM10027612_84810 [Microbispora bryophytorum subsp. camponoti]
MGRVRVGDVRTEDGAGASIWRGPSSLSSAAALASAAARSASATASLPAVRRSCSLPSVTVAWLAGSDSVNAFDSVLSAEVTSLGITHIVLP